MLTCRILWKRPSAAPGSEGAGGRCPRRRHTPGNPLPGVVNRKAMPATNKMATMLCSTFPCITSKKKKTEISRIVKIDPKAIIFIERSFCVRMLLFASEILNELATCSVFRNPIPLPNTITSSVRCVVVLSKYCLHNLLLFFVMQI